MKEYLDLLRTVINGERKENRTGVDMLSTFAYPIKIDLREGFPLLTTKKMPWKAIVCELVWFLLGRNDQAFLKKHGVYFWEPWNNPDGTVNAAYGPAWRHFGCSSEDRNGEFDQLGWVFNRLVERPMARDMVMSAWNPAVACYPPKSGSYIAPCHFAVCFNVQKIDGENHLCLHWSQRSCDVCLGVPFNIASYALLAHIAARVANMKVGYLAATLIDAHIYVSKPDGSKEEYNHLPNALKQLMRDPLEKPTLEISESIKSLKDIEALADASTEEIMSKFVLKNYKSHPALEFKVAV